MMIVIVHASNMHTYTTHTHTHIHEHLKIHPSCKNFINSNLQDQHSSVHVIDTFQTFCVLVLFKKIIKITIINLGIRY